MDGLERICQSATGVPSCRLLMPLFRGCSISTTISGPDDARVNKGLFARACSTAPSANGVVGGAALAASAGLRCERVTMRSIGWRGK